MGNEKKIMPSCALISVSDKCGMVEFAGKISTLGVKIIATQGTHKLLCESGIEAIPVSDITNFPEIMGGRVKTLHPSIYGAILGERDLHHDDALKHGIEWIDLVVCNLYNFAKEALKDGSSLDNALSYIDIGGVTMIRAAAKNFPHVVVITDINDYKLVLDELENDGGVSFKTRKCLAKKAFLCTSQYDAVIQGYFDRPHVPFFRLRMSLSSMSFFRLRMSLSSMLSTMSKIFDSRLCNAIHKCGNDRGARAIPSFMDIAAPQVSFPPLHKRESRKLKNTYYTRLCAKIKQIALSRNNSNSRFPDAINLSFRKVKELRHGENPHQSACAYQSIGGASTNNLLQARQLQGKELSYNNILDSKGACDCVRAFGSPSCVIVKHGNPCGVASGEGINEAFSLAYDSDSKSAFGGVVALNQAVTREIAEMVSKIFIEIIIAPAFDWSAIAILKEKPNLRLLEFANLGMERVGLVERYQYRCFDGCLLVQDSDLRVITKDDLIFVTKRRPSDVEIQNVLFAWKVVKHVKSNAIVVANSMATIGIGGGQSARVDALELALKKAGARSHNAVLASDAFFPFSDSIQLLANAGITAIIQPGGSIRDDEIIACCDKNGIAMVFSGSRCFSH